MKVYPVAMRRFTTHRKCIQEITAWPYYLACGDTEGRMHLLFKQVHISVGILRTRRSDYQ